MAKLKTILIRELEEAIKRPKKITPKSVLVLTEIILNKKNVFSMFLYYSVIFLKSSLKTYGAN